jgi:hypothetical protein
MVTYLGLEPSVPCSQDSSTGPNCEPVTDRRPHPLYSYYLPDVLVTLTARTENVSLTYYVVGPTCSSNLILVGLITLTIFGTDYNYETPDYAVF